MNENNSKPPIDITGRRAINKLIGRTAKVMGKHAADAIRKNPPPGMKEILSEMDRLIANKRPPLKIVEPNAPPSVLPPISIEQKRKEKSQE